MPLAQQQVPGFSTGSGINILHIALKKAGGTVARAVLLSMQRDCPGGKSGLRRTRWWVTPTGRKTRESATESKPPKPVRFFVSHGDFMQRRQVARTAKRLKNPKQLCEPCFLWDFA